MEGKEGKNRMDSNSVSTAVAVFCRDYPFQKNLEFRFGPFPNCLTICKNCVIFLSAIFFLITNYFM